MGDFSAQQHDGPQASPAGRSYKCCQSPMTAYFGDDTVSTYFSDGTNMSFGTPLNCMPSPAFTPQFASAPAQSCRPGIPCKSPMSAYFDGDSEPLSFNFHLATSPQPSPKMAKSSRQRTGLKCVRFEDDAAAETMKTVEAEGTVSDQKACIRLTELLDLPEDDSRASKIQGNVWKLSQEAQGCRDVQQAIQSSALPIACRLVLELHGHVSAAAQCPHANHVLRKAITTVPAAAFNFILEELLGRGASHLAEMAKHRFGCRIVEGLLEKGNASQIARICESLLENAATLSSHMYGNFVMQRVALHASAHHRSSLIQMLRSQLQSVGASFFGSTVLRQALQHGGQGERQMLAADVASEPGMLAAIAKYKHGKSVVDSVLDTLSGGEREAALQQLSAPPMKVLKVTVSAGDC